MTPERFQRVVEIFHRLKELPESELQSSLDEACGLDDALRAEVLGLLDADRSTSAGSFLARPALEDAARLASTGDIGLPKSGTVLGKYRLGARLGAGGMGVVFVAEDLRLKRRAAVKVLPVAFGAGLGYGETDRIRRFEREARAASLLNHPNIVSIYDAEFDCGCYYIAMEYIEGRTLRAEIETRGGAANPEWILDVVSQVAAALSAAHEAGVVHRDIKPENIMLRPDGLVKVLDFGLATVREAEAEAGNGEKLTRKGQLPGTIHYLSPEQVMGGAATERSDLFSLGVVAYELVTGARPFAGATDGMVFEAILTREPARPSVQRADLSIGLEALILRALEKDPESRFHTATELRVACQSLMSDPARWNQAMPDRRRSGWDWVTPSTVLAMAMVLAGLAGGWFWWTQREGGSVKAVNVQQLTDSPGEQIWPKLTADGKQFVFASARDGNLDIFLQRVGGSAAINLTRATKDADSQPAVSALGGRIAFRSEREGGGLYVMEATGENPRRFSENGYFPAWSPNGREVAYCTHSFDSPTQAPPPPSELWAVEVETGARRRLETGDALQPAWSPHGYRIAYWGVSEGGRRDLYTVRADGSGAVRVTNDAAVDWNPVWDPTGRWLYFLSDRGGGMNIWRIGIDERSGNPRGSPEPVTVPAERVAALALSAGGQSLIYSSADRRIALARVGFDGPRKAVYGPVEALADGHAVGGFTFSQDGKWIAYDTISDSTENLWIMNADGGERRRITSDSFRNRGPVWSPDGNRIVYYSDRNGHYDLWLIRPDGSGMRALTNAAGLNFLGGVWSPDGKRILTLGFGRMRELDPVESEVKNPREVAAVRNLPGLVCYAWTQGRDGSQALCLLLNKGGLQGARWQMAVFQPGTGQLERIPVEANYVDWAPGVDTREPHRYFVFARGPEMILYDRRLMRQTRLLTDYPNTIFCLGVEPDGKRIYFSRTIRKANLWLARLDK